MGLFASNYLTIFMAVVGLVNIVCFLTVLVKMFAHEYVGTAIICILLGCAGLGGFVAFVFGWTKAEEWRMSTLMTVWSMAVIAFIAFVGGSVVMAK